MNSSGLDLIVRLPPGIYPIARKPFFCDQLPAWMRICPSSRTSCRASTVTSRSMYPPRLNRTVHSPVCTSMSNSKNLSTPIFKRPDLYASCKRCLIFAGGSWLNLESNSVSKPIDSRRYIVSPARRLGSASIVCMPGGMPCMSRKLALVVFRLSICSPPCISMKLARVDRRLSTGKSASVGVLLKERLLVSALRPGVLSRVGFLGGPHDCFRIGSNCIAALLGRRLPGCMLVGRLSVRLLRTLAINLAVAECGRANPAATRETVDAGTALAGRCPIALHCSRDESLKLL
mmetsp:Transcript_152197/g.291534  ORF Transcript_152197/g.291534 Transcript_152197/m.291534 type:complete len:289 (-) Transcript_152197:230-1096(-)